MFTHAEDKSSPCQSESKLRPIENLALSGGVVRGIAHLGVFAALEEAGIMKNIKRISGTSVGALMGLLPALGMTTSVSEDYLLNKISLPQFKDIDLFDLDEYYSLAPTRYNPISTFLKVVHNVVKVPYLMAKTGINFFKDEGLCNGNYIEQVVRNIIKTQTGRETLTFKELHDLIKTNSHYKDLYITGVNRTNNQLEIFSYETTPDMPIEKAIHISMAIPGVYKKVIYNDKEYIDGGLYSSLPMHIFDNDGFNARTIGASLSSAETTRHVRDNKIYDKREGNMVFYIMAPLHVQDEIARMSADPIRTIFLKLDHVNPHDFNIKNESFLDMIKSAKKDTWEYINDYIKGVSDPNNALRKSL